MLICLYLWIRQNHLVYFGNGKLTYSSPQTLLFIILWLTYPPLYQSTEKALISNSVSSSWVLKSEAKCIFVEVSNAFASKLKISNLFFSSAVRESFDFDEILIADCLQK